VSDFPTSLFRLPARAASGLIWIYQRAVSPALTVISPNTGCRFSPTCSHYAREALAEHGFVSGLYLTARRLLKCGPWHPGGEDPVPPRQFSCSAVRPGSSLATHHSSLSNG
jgi:putative membrane protein insertion efficiency factor